MATVIRLKRIGAKKDPSYRIIVTDSRNKRDGRHIEQLGFYDPQPAEAQFRVDTERAQYWLGVGAQPSDQVRSLFKKAGVAWPEWPKPAKETEAKEKRTKASSPGSPREQARRARKKEARVEKKALVVKKEDQAKAAAVAAKAKAAEEAVKAKEAEEAAAAEAAEKAAAAKEEPKEEPKEATPEEAPSS